MKVLEVRGLTKYFNGQKVLDDLNFDLNEGEALGFLGPNGAGKTTTLRIITGLYRPSAGRVFIAGIDAVANPIKTKGLFGVCTQDFSFNAHYSIEQDLYFYARLYGLPRRAAMEKARRALEWADLLEHRRKNGDHLSGGMRKKILFARAMINDPPLLLLDEPTTGLDVHARRELWEMIRDLKSRGKSILLITHYLEEAEQLCDRILIIKKGRLVAEGGPGELRQIVDVARLLTVDLYRQLTLEEKEWLCAFPGVKNCKSRGTTVEVALDSSPQRVGDFVQEICRRLQPLGISLRDASLEEVFLEVTGRED
ncbi:MAG: Nod factor export ATP-binding protein I [Thermoanaerobacterales bacterium 50_218]|nr:MAG: Nod factor export ATP-binding protein I [Thermoanaerobacterales bacterium 50_218]